MTTPEQDRAQIKEPKYGTDASDQADEHQAPPRRVMNDIRQQLGYELASYDTRLSASRNIDMQSEAILALISQTVSSVIGPDDNPKRHTGFELAVENQNDLRAFQRKTAQRLLGREV